MKKIQVSYLGLNSLFGRVTTNLLKQSPCIEKLSLYDEDDNSQLEDGANVFIGRGQLSEAVKNVDIVVIGDELCGTHGEERLKIIGPKIIRYTEAILASSPNAIIVVAASPLNILVPLVGHFLGPDWHHRLLGITSVDTLRASRIFNGLLNNPLGEAHILPVVGGSSATSRVPLFSHTHPKTLICKDIRDKILEKMKSFDNSKYRETDSVERAYSAVRFIHSIISGMLKDSPIPEIAMTKTTEIPNAEFFSLPMLIGKNGIEYAMPLPKFDESEEKMFLEATERLAEDSRKARNFINSLAQESVRNSNSDSNVCLKNSESVQTDGGFSARGVQEATSSKRTSARRAFQKLDKGIHSVNKHCNKVGYENRDFKYRLWAKPTDDEKELQEIPIFSRKTIPTCPDYQLIPGTKAIGRDFRKGVEDDKTTKSTNTSVGSAESKTTHKMAEDASSNCGRVLTSQTQTVLETSNRVEAVKEQDIPQPGAIQQLIPEVKHSVASSNDPNPLKENTLERLPSPQDSDASADESVDSDSTQTLLEEVNHHLGTLGKYASTITQIEAHKNDSKLMTDEFTHPDDYENGGNRVVDNGIPERIYQNNNGIAPDSCSRKHPKHNVRLVSKSDSEVDATFSNSKKDLPSHNYNHEYLKRNRTVPTKNYDREECIVNGNTENNLPTYDVQIDSVRTLHHSRNKSTFPSFENNCEKPKVQHSSLDKLKQAEDAQDPNQNSRQNKVATTKNLGENVGVSSTDVASNNHLKNLSRETTEISLYGGKKPVSKRPASNEERSNQYTKDRYSNKFPGVRRIPKMFPVRAVASEERILCLSDSRNVKILNDYPKVELIRDRPTKLSKASTPKMLSKPSIPPEEDFGKSEKFERPQSKATTPDSSSIREFPTGTKTLKDVRWSKNGEDFVASSLLAAKSRDADSYYMKKELHSSQSIPSQSETPLKLLNLPGGKQRYETNHKMSEFEERPKDTTDVDLFTETTKTELTADKTKGYYMRQKRGSALNNNQTYGSSLNLGSSKRKRSTKKSSENREISTMKRKSTKVKSQLPNERKKVDCKKSDGKQSRAVVNQCRTTTKLKQHTDSRNTLSRNTTNKEKCELGDVPAKSSSSAKENEWESKYFTKASEMFFRMFKDTVSNNKIAHERALKMNDVFNESVDVKKKVQGTKSRSLDVPNVQSARVETQDPSRKENVKMNRNLHKKVPFEVNSVKDSTKQNGTVEKPASNNVRSTVSDNRKAKTLKVNKENCGNLKMNQKRNGMKSVKNTEGPSVNKLNMLQSLDSKAETEVPLNEKKGAENSVFNTKITGMEKYQIEKNDNMKKEIKMNSPIDVEKLFEESSTIPLDSYQGSDSKLWMSTGVTEKGTKHGLANQQPFLQGVLATSDKGKGDAMNMVDFSISKNSGPLRYDVGQTGLKTFLETSSNGRTAQPTSTPKNDADWRVPISSKTIKQVNPQNYKEQILNSNMRKMEDDVQSCEKTNKWDRILTIFKHIITSDLEDKSTNFARSVEFGKCLKDPVQLREAPLKMSNAPLKIPNQKIVKGKISSTVKKKTETAKKKQPTETIRRNRVVKNNPKKIVNYFSKRGHSCSAKEKPILAKLVVNSFEQNPEFFNEHTVNVTKKIKPEMSIPPKIK